MQTKIYTTGNKIIAFLISLLGFTSACNKDIKIEYGTPYGTFILKVTVISDKDNSEIPHIQVLMDDTAYRFNPDTSFTDLNGKFAYNLKIFPENTQTIRFVLNDIDSSENGKFKNLDTVITFKGLKYKDGDGDWNAGTTEQDIVLKMSPEKK